MVKICIEISKKKIEQLKARAKKSGIKISVSNGNDSMKHNKRKSKKFKVPNIKLVKDYGKPTPGIN